MTRDELLARLRAAKPLLDGFGVARIGVFGSVARNAARADSDIDLLVEFRAGEAPGFGFFDLEEKLSSLLERPVQIASLDAMNAVVRASVLRDLAYA
jgi:predicted nucleotidyltransferase